MINLEGITQEDINLIKEVIDLKRINKPQVVQMQYIMTNFIDAKCHICTHCSSQIRFTHKRIVNWYAKNIKLIESILNPNKKICVVCGKEITNSRRKNYCSKDCKNGKKINR